MTRSEYNQTLLSVLGISGDPAAPIPVETRQGGYNNQIAAQYVQRADVEGWEAAARAASATAVVDLNTLMGCPAVGSSADACFDSFLNKVGAGLFRRPLAPEETQRYQTYYAAQRMTADGPRAVELALTALLMSPSTLFFVEKSAENQEAKLSGYELATRLSYLFWNAPPDAALLEQAASGALDTPLGLRTSAERLLQSPRSRDTLRDFHEQWVGVTELGNAKLPPGVAASARESAATEIDRFIDDWFSLPTPRVSELFTSRRAYIDGELAKVYGVTPPSQPGFVDLPSAQRAGLLTRLVFLGAHSIPPSRGDFVLNRVLCNPVPPIPVQPSEPPDLGAMATTRQRFEKHSEDPCASACHGILDPVGFAFEHYDSMGSWRDTENGTVVDSATVLSIPADPEIDGPVSGGVELSERIGSSRMAQSCLAKQWFQYAYGREATDRDTCSVSNLASSLVSSSGDVRELLLSLTQTDAFRYVRKEQP